MKLTDEPLDPNWSESQANQASRLGRRATDRAGVRDLDQARNLIARCRAALTAAVGSVPLAPPLKHPVRTIIVATRISEKTLHTTYLNALDDDQPYIVTVALHGPLPVGGEVPNVGETKVTVNR